MNAHRLWRWIGAVLVLWPASVRSAPAWGPAGEADAPKILEQAVDHLRRSYPEFQPDRGSASVWENAALGKWSVYLFDTRDGGIGYEVLADQGVLSDKFDQRLFRKRLELIEYMNGLMPANREYNAHVGFDPVRDVRWRGCRVSYAVVAPRIDVKRQLEVDFLVLTKAAALLKDFGLPSTGIFVEWFEADQARLDGFVWPRLLSPWLGTRSLQRTTFFPQPLLDEAIIRYVATYALAEEPGGKPFALPASPEDYRAALKALLATFPKPSRDKNSRLIDELTSEQERRAAALAKSAAAAALKPGERYTLLMRQEGTGLYFNDVGFSPDGARLAFSSRLKQIDIHDVATGGKILEIVHEGRGPMSLLRSLSFSPDGTRLAAGNFDRGVDLWDARSGKHLGRLSGHRSKVRVIGFSPDGRLLASAAEDSALKIWEVASGREVASLPHNQRYTLAFTPDGRRLVFGNQVFDTRTWRLERTLREVKEALALSPDGKRLAAYNPQAERVELRDFGSEALVRQLDLQTHPPRGLCFSPDGKYLAVAHDDEIVRIWSLERGTVVNSLEERGSGAARSLRYSRDGRKLAVAWDNLVAAYQVE